MIVIHKIMNAILVLSSLFLLGFVSVQAWSKWSDTAQTQTTGELSTISGGYAQTQTQTSLYRPQQILNAKLFGYPKAPERTVVQTVVPKTRLSLKLHGMVGSSDPLLARALVSVAGQIPQSLGIGEKIPNTDAHIHRIEEARVLLDRAGQIESLVLERDVLN